MGNSSSTTIGAVILTLSVAACDSSVDDRDNTELDPQANSPNAVTGSAVSVSALDAVTDEVAITTETAVELVESTHAVDATTEVSNESEDLIADSSSVGSEEITWTGDADTYTRTQEPAAHQENISDNHISPTIISEPSSPPGVPTETDSSTDNTVTVHNSSSEAVIAVEEDAANDNGAAASASSNISIDLSEVSEPNIDTITVNDSSSESVIAIGEDLANDNGAVASASSSISVDLNEVSDSSDSTITVSDTSSESVIAFEGDTVSNTTSNIESIASSSSDISIDVPDIPTNLTDISIDLSGGSDLTGSVNTELEYCVQVGEIVEFGVAGRVYDLETGFTLSNLTAYSTLQHSNHPNVQLISHSDAGISVTVTEEDIVDLTVQYENDINQIFISAINNGGSRPLLLKKRFHYDSCGFALYTSSECDYVTSGSVQVSLNADGTSITTQGCDILENVNNVPVVEIE